MLERIKEHAKACIFCKLFILFIFGGSIYVDIELLYRGHSHWTMFIVGGLCFIIVGGINNYIDEKMLFQYQCLLASVVITTLEFICGYIVNIKLGWNIWDYSEVPLNIMGQICLPFSIAWIFVGGLGIVIDDVLRNKLFDTPMPKYYFTKNQRDSE